MSRLHAVLNIDMVAMTVDLVAYLQERHECLNV